MNTFVKKSKRNIYKMTIFIMYSEDKVVLTLRSSRSLDITLNIQSSHRNKHSRIICYVMI